MTTPPLPPTGDGQEPVPTPELATDALRGQIAAADSALRALPGEPTAMPSPRPPRSRLPWLLAALALLGAALFDAWRTAQRPPGTEGLRTGLEIQAMQVRAALRQRGRLPSSLDEVSRIDPGYELRRTADDAFVVYTVVRGDTFAVSVSGRDAALQWIPPRPRE